MLQNSSMIFKSLVSTKRHILILCQPSLNHTHILRCPAHAHASARTVVLLAPRCPGFRHRRKFTLDPRAARKKWIKNGILLGYYISAKNSRSLLVFIYIYIYNPFQQKNYKYPPSPPAHPREECSPRCSAHWSADQRRSTWSWMRGTKIHLLDWKNTWWREFGQSAEKGWWSSLHCSEIRIKIPSKVPV